MINLGKIAPKKTKNQQFKEKLLQKWAKIRIFLLRQLKLAKF
jgi:hypothetical protein